MRVADLWERTGRGRVITIQGGATTSAAAELMRDHQIGSLLVTEGQDRLVGILTERDLLSRVLAEGRDPAATTVEQVMTRPVTCCEHSTPLGVIRDTLTRRGVRHMPVAEDGRPVAILSIRDVMAAMADEERDARELTIFSMAKLAESRDPETGLHLERVRDYVAALARVLRERPGLGGEIDETYITLLQATSVLHDIGKVAVPDHVLLKPDRLTDDEFQIMKMHTTRGAETLELALDRFPDARFLAMARDIAGSHHERYDGKGYPSGLSGEQIPLAARIFALADVYDALVTKRVYKEAFSHELARSIIHDTGSGQFDPAVMEAFDRCQQQFRAIRDQYAQVRAAA